MRSKVNAFFLPFEWEESYCPQLGILPTFVTLAFQRNETSGVKAMDSLIPFQSDERMFGLVSILHRKFILHRGTEGSPHHVPFHSSQINVSMLQADPIIFKLYLKYYPWRINLGILVLH